VVDFNGDGEITKKELQNGFESMTNDWKALRRSWTGHETVSRAYEISMRILYIIIGVIMWMIVFSIDPLTVLAPIVSS
jgi:hypothetical protein